MRVFGPRFLAILIVQVALACFCSQARADDGDPPTRVARLAYIEGSISFQPAGTNDWVAAGRNRPITIGDKIWSDSNGRVEMQLDGSLLRLSHDTGCSFLNLSDNATQVQLTAGTLLVQVRRLDQNETYEIDTPNLAFSLLRAGLYKVAVDENGDATTVVIRSGEGEVTGGGAAYTIHAHESYVFSGTDQLYATREDSDRQDQFDAWAIGRDQRWENSRSEQYVSNDVIGYQDLDEYGSWRQSSAYGSVWFPRVTSGWAPYRDGHWDYIEPWGYTWVDDAPWGFAPFHYGRWVNYEGAWGWVPAPHRTEGVTYVRPVYAPALVAWVGGGAGAEVGWFALGPREVYVPGYPVSRSYVERVNVSNTVVNATAVNNYYNTTIVNKNTTVTNVNYVNRTVPGAVVATSAQAFSTAQPVARNAARIDPHVATSGRVDPITPTIAPVKQAVLGSAPAKSQPPPKVETRAVVAKATPPPPPPSFERRQEAIKKNGGKPLTDSQVKQMASPAQRQQATIKIAPAAQRASTPPPQPPNRAPQPDNESRPKNQPAPAPSNRPGDRPPASQSEPQTNQPSAPNNVQPKPAERPAEHPPEPPPDNKKPPKNPPVGNENPATRPVHPSNQPPTGHTTPPPASSPNLEKKHEQEQKQLRDQQEEERRRLQQEQQQEHAKAATSQADQAQKRRMEQQHEQQVQQQQQKHAQEQKQLEQKQQEERKNQNKPQKPAPPSP